MPNSPFQPPQAVHIRNNILDSQTAREYNEQIEIESFERTSAMRRHIEQHETRLEAVTRSVSAPIMGVDMANSALSGVYYSSKPRTVDGLKTTFFSNSFRNSLRDINYYNRYTIKSIVFNSAARFTMKKIVDEEATNTRPVGAPGAPTNTRRNLYKRRKTVSGCRPTSNENLLVLQNTRHDYDNSTLDALQRNIKVKSNKIQLPYTIVVDSFANNMIFKIHEVREGLGYKKGLSLARRYSDIDTTNESTKLLLFDEVYSMTVTDKYTFVKLQLTFDKKDLEEYYVDKAIVYAGLMYKYILNSFSYTEEYRLHSVRPIVVQLEILYNPVRYHYTSPDIRDVIDERIRQEIYIRQTQSYSNEAKNSAVSFGFDELSNSPSPSAQTQATTNPFSSYSTTTATSTPSYSINSRREYMMRVTQQEEIARMRSDAVYMNSKIFKIIDVIGDDIEKFYEKKANIIYQFINTKRVKACRDAFEESDKIVRQLVNTVKYLK